MSTLVLRYFLKKTDMDLVKYLDSPAGAGKTYVLARYAAELVNNGEFVLLVQPSIKLGRETADLLETEHRVPCASIHSESSHSPVKTIMRHLRPPLGRPRVICITAEAFKRIDFIPARTALHLIIDERLQANQWFSQPESECGELSSILKTTCSEIAGHETVDRSCGKQVIALGRRLKDEAIQTLGHTIGSQHTTCFTRMRTSTENNNLSVFSLLNPSLVAGYKSVTMAGALFDRSVLYSVWKRQGVSFLESPLKNRLRFQSHPNGRLIRVLHCFEGSWSKTIRNKVDYSLIERIESAAVQQFTGQEFLYSVNKDIEDHVFKNLPNAIQLPHSTHGLNTFQAFNNVVLLSAFKQDTTQRKYFQDICGMTSNDVIQAIHNEMSYQAVMRTSIRNPVDHNPKTIIVPDSDTAQFLCSMFEGAESAILEIGLDQYRLRGKLGRPRLHPDDAAKQRACRQNQQRRMRERFAAEFAGHIDQFTNSEEYSDEISFRKIDIVSQFFGSEFSGKNSPHGEIILLQTLKQFRRYLKSHSRREYDDKELIPLISPSLFMENEDTCKARGYDNVLFSNGLFFDFENGDMLPKDVARIFPYLAFISYSTHRHTHEFPRFRIYVPTSHIVFPEEYRWLFRRTAETFEEAGFANVIKIQGSAVRVSGLDLTKRSPENLMKLPCVGADKSASFYKEYFEKARKPLDVLAALQKMPGSELHPVSTGQSGIAR